MTFDHIDQRILFDWTVAHLPLLAEDGDVIVPDPAPLTTDQIVEVLTEIGKSDVFKDHTISVPDREGNRSTLRRVNGEPQVDANVVQDAPHPQTMPYGTAIFITPGEEEDDA